MTEDLYQMEKRILDTLTNQRNRARTCELDFAEREKKAREEWQRNRLNHGRSTRLRRQIEKDLKRVKGMAKRKDRYIRKRTLANIGKALEDLEML